MMNLPETPVNESEMELADTITEILIESINKYAGIEVVEDETLDFQEQFKHHEPESIEDSKLE